MWKRTTIALMDGLIDEPPNRLMSMLASGKDDATNTQATAGSSPQIFKHPRLEDSRAGGEQMETSVQSESDRGRIR